MISQVRNCKKPDTDVLAYDDNNDSVSYRKFYSAEYLLLPFLYDFCKNNKVQLHICGSSIDNSVQERAYYFSILKHNNFIFHENTSFYSSYNTVDKFRNVVSIDSTLGLEAVRRNKRVAFFNIRGEYLNTKSYNFGWPLDLGEFGDFWLNKFTIEKAKEILNFMVYSNDSQWYDAIRFFDEILVANKNNTIFVETIENILNNSRC